MVRELDPNWSIYQKWNIVNLLSWAAGSLIATETILTHSATNERQRKCFFPNKTCCCRGVVKRIVPVFLLNTSLKDLPRFIWKEPSCASYTIAGHLLGSYQHLHAQISDQRGSKADPGILQIKRQSEACWHSSVSVTCDVIGKAVTSLCKLGCCFESAFFGQLLYLLLARNKVSNDNFTSEVLQVKW